MAKRDQAVLIGALVGGLFGGAVAYLLAPEPEEPETSLLSNIGFKDVVALSRAAVGFLQQLGSVQQKGAGRGRGRRGQRA